MEWHPTPVFLPGEFHRQRSLAGYSPWDRKGLNTTEQLRLTLKYFHPKQLQVHCFVWVPCKILFNQSCSVIFYKKKAFKNHFHSLPLEDFRLKEIHKEKDN